MSLESLVLQEFKSLRLPALEVRTKPEGTTLVHHPTEFYVERPEKERSLGRILGHRVTVSITPVTYRWSFGDGEVKTTSGRGGEGAKGSVRHTYERSGGMGTSVTTAYRARYRVDGGESREIPGTVSVEGPVTTLDVREARTELVGGPR